MRAGRPVFVAPIVITISSGEWVLLSRSPSLKNLFATKSLKVGILNPLFYQVFVAQVLQLLQYQKTAHQSDRLGRAAFLSIEGRQFVFQKIPRYLLAEKYQWILRIEMLQQISPKQVALISMSLVRFHALKRCPFNRDLA